MADNERPTDARVKGPHELVGRYVYDVVADRWTWSESIYTMHGFAVGEVVPTTDLVLAHHHPDDLDKSRQVVKEALEAEEPFSSYHRIMDARSKTHTVLVAGHGVRDAEGRLVEVRGYMVDLTEARRRDLKDEVSAAVAGATESRAVIDQAKGVLILVFGVDADEAFGLLSAHSQDNNIRVRDLAARLIEALQGDNEIVGPGTRRRILELLQNLGPDA